MALLIFYVTLALGVSFLCSILEAVLLSITPGYAAARTKEGGELAEKLLAFKQDIDKPLAAILSLNTIAHTVGAAGAGAQAAVVFGDVYLGLASGVLTLLILVVSEIIPKTLGAVYWRQLTPLVVRTLGPIIWIMWPLVRLSKLITMRLASHQNTTLDREEISAMAELGHKEGVLDSQESKILENLMRADSLRAVDVMTPRTVVFSLEENNTVAEVLAQHADIIFSRIPVFAEHPEAVTGYILKDALLLHGARDQDDVQLKEFKREIIAVASETAITDLLQRLLRHKEHIAIVLGQYGGLAGLVTLEDIVETVLGLEIQDETDAVADMQEFARQRWRRRAQSVGLVMDEDDTQIPSGHLRLTGGGPPKKID